MRIVKLALAGVLLAGLAACGHAQPDHGTGAASAPAQNGGLAGAQEGNPGNAHNIGTDSGTLAK